MSAGYALLLLFVSMVLNVGDRALLGIVVEPIKAELLLSDTQISLVSGPAFVLFNLIVGVFIARTVDTGNRKRILVWGMALWSAATAGCGLVNGFASLGLMRVLVGVGEATTVPVAVSMIGDLFRADRRPRAISLFQAGAAVGIVLGSILAGTLAAAHGWRDMFLYCGVAGLLFVAVVMLTFREPERAGEVAGASPTSREYSLRTFAELFSRPGFSLLSLGLAFGGVNLAVLPVWAPAFLLRSHGVPLSQVGRLIGPAISIGGVAGTVIAGFLASHLVRRRGVDAAGLLVPLVAMPLAVPFYLYFLLTSSVALAMVAVALMNLLLASITGPCIAVAVSLVPARRRAVASALMLVPNGVIAGSIAPFIVGVVSDALPQYGADALRYGLASMTLAPIASAFFLWLAMRRIRLFAGG